MTVSHATDLARLGSSLILSAAQVSSFDLTAIARVVASAPGFSQLTIKDTACLSHTDMATIARVGKGRIVFDLS